MPILVLLPKADVPPLPPDELEAIPTLLVEMDLGNLIGGGIWDEGLWDSTFIWGPVAPTYPEDISEWVRAANTTRGAQNELDRIEAGTAVLTLDNRDGRFTPYLPGPYFPNILPMRRIRIRAVSGAAVGWGG